MKTKYDNVADAAAALAGDKAVKGRVQTLINKSAMVNVLIGMRTQSGLSQADIAKKMNCTQSKISKLESGSDDTLKWSDIVGYIHALELNMHLFFNNENLPRAARIKNHVLQVHGLLEELADLAKGVCEDEIFVSKIHEFYGEVLMNFLVKFEETYKQLPSNGSSDANDGDNIKLTIPSFQNERECPCQ